MEGITGMTCSRPLIEKIVERFQVLDTGIHMHLCEHKDEVSFCLQNYGKRPAEFLEEMGALGFRLLAAHNVLLTERDISLIMDSPTFLPYWRAGLFWLSAATGPPILLWKTER